MPAPVTRLTARNLDAVFGRTPWMLARVDRVPTASMLPGLLEYLDHRFPNLFTFVTVARTDFNAAQLSELFQSAVGPLRGGVGDGYYLLEAGLVVGSHTGTPRPSNISYGSEAEEEAQRARILATPRVVVGGHDLETLRQVVAYLEPIVERKQRAAGFGTDGFSGSGSAGSHANGHSYGSYTSPSTPLPAPGRDDPDDPHVILGVEPGATQEQIKAAFREQLKLNHPDKVAHLSPALQAFAAQQTLRLKAAYERLLRR